MDQMKRCTKCGVEKELGEFHRDKTRKDGRYPWCRDCKNAGSRNGARIIPHAPADGAMPIRMPIANTALRIYQRFENKTENAMPLIQKCRKSDTDCIARTTKLW